MITKDIIVYVLVLLLSLIFTTIVIKCIIPMLKRKEFGQKILENGPVWHKNKEGTPTMGGLSFLLTITITIIIEILILFNKSNIRQTLLMINILLYSVLNALIGIIDDIAKIRKSKNQGLTGTSKFILQSIAAIIFLILVKNFVGINTGIYIPFSGKYIELGVFYYFFAYLLLCGIVNSVNLSDGIDGLATTLIATVAVFFSICSFFVVENKYLQITSASILGATIGFLKFNKNPAKIFMGDTGSLFFGSLIVSMSFIFDNILLVVLYGMIFIIEAISDILQVAYFKITKGKRLFLMAPLHHHLEKKGWSENKIVCIFSLINIIFCILAYVSML